MISKLNKEKGILANLLEQGIRILLIKECKKIINIKIDIIASSIEIIKGEIQKINIIAEDINYKDLLFDAVQLESTQIKMNFNLKNKEFDFKNKPKVNLKVSLSGTSMKKILLSKKWNWIGAMINNKILNQGKLEDIKIKNNQILIKASKDNSSIIKEENINIKEEKGKIYLENKSYNKNTMNIPIEDKVFIKNVNIENNLIIIFAYSSISF